VDDFLLTHNDDSLCEQTIDALKSEFEITDLGTPRRLLGLRITRDNPTGPISIDQSETIVDILRRFKMEQCKPAITPHQPGLHLTDAMSPTTQADIDSMKNVPYRVLVGCLLWLATNTRPDIAHAVGCLCRFSANPGQQHWTAAKHVLRYLAGTQHYGITNPTLINHLLQRGPTQIGLIVQIQDAP